MIGGVRCRNDRKHVERPAAGLANGTNCGSYFEYITIAKLHLIFAIENHTPILRTNKQSISFNIASGTSAVSPRPFLSLA